MEILDIISNIIYKIVFVLVALTGLGFFGLILLKDTWELIRLIREDRQHSEEAVDLTEEK